jgi:dolichol kinase
VHLSPAFIAAAAAIATVLENFAVAGLDNLLVPVVVALLLISV